MNSVKTITPQGWMTSPATKAVMEALGGEQDALFVGGCVRNALLGFEVGDIDIATKHHPETVMKRLKAANIKAIPTGVDHGTITAVIDKQSFEITTLRKDVEADGRRATIAFAETWEEDARRRDFTMNTLLADMKGNIFDPLGCGVEDLRERKVVFVGDPEQRIQEDYLRILRFFRFHALYGENAPEDKALKACAKYADKIETLSRERITQEFLKIISVDKPEDILRIMFDNNVLKDLEYGGLETLKHLCTFQNNYGLGFVASRLFALADFSLSHIKAMEEYLLLPKVFKKDMQAIDGILRLENLSNEHALKVAVYKFGRVPAAQSLMIELATDRVMNGYAPKALEIIQNWDIPTFPVTGEDLMKQGIPQGPELGRELSRLEEEWIAGGF